MTKLCVLFIGLIMGILVAVQPLEPPVSYAEKVLDLGDPIGGPSDAPGRIALEFFTAEVAKRTNGEIVVKYHPQTIVTSETKAVEMCKLGAVALCATGGATGTIFPNTQPLMLPYIIRDYAHFYNLIRGPIGKEIEAEIEKKHHLKVVYWFDFGFRQFANTKKPINTPMDMQGLKLRVMPSPPLADMVNALGASAVPISWAEAIPAVQQGVVDGLDLPVINLIKARIYEIAKYAAITNHYFSPTLVLANLNVWNGFTKAQQDIILKIGLEAGDKNRELMEKADAEGKALLEKYGMEVTTPDLTPFMEIAKSKVYPKYYEKFGKETVERIVSGK